jgi:arylsulfatase A-like enzyme
VCVIPLALLGPFGSSRVDAHGRHRNALVALVQSGLPQVRSSAAGRDWRTSPFEHAVGDDLARLRGAARTRNVVVVSLESTAAQYLALYGGRDDVMPALGALARESVVFEHAYAAYPESIKGLFSLLCSTFPAFDVEPETLGRVPCAALPALLRAAGYATGLFHSGRFDYLGMQAVIDDRGYDALEDAGDIGGIHRSSFGVDEPSTVARMLAWVDALPPDRPFFLTYLPIAGHHPYATPSPGIFSNENEFGRYRNALRYGDASLAALADGLRRRGLDRDTIWIIFGDHGEAFGQHDGNYGHTFFLYEENVRVPFIVAAPGLTGGQTRVNRVVSLVDIAPTVLDLLGMDVPDAYQGQSALGGAPKMALFFTDYSLPLAGLVDGRWKAVHDLNAGRTRIFDLANDPGETRDLAVRFPARASWYAETLKGWSAAQKDYVLTAAARRRIADPGITARGSGP